MPLQTIESAIEQIQKHTKRLPSEAVLLTESAGRTLATAVSTDRDSPPFTKSMMDGFAVRYSEILQEKPFEVSTEIAAGQTAEVDFPAGSVVRIMTGAPVPDEADAVIPVEQAVNSSDGRVSFSIVPKFGANILTQGSIAQAGEVVLNVGEKLDAGRIAALAEFGIAKVNVSRRPTVAILATGDELVAFDEEPQSGQIRNSNGPMLAALMDSFGCEVRPLGIARDNVDDLDRAIATGLNADLLLLSGGVSAGLYDLVPDRLAAAGVREVVHKVAIKPGKPIWFGTSDKTLVFGLPGNPVSSLVCGTVFVAPAIRAMTGGIAPPLSTLSATLTSPHRQKGDRTTYWPSRLSFEANGPRVEPLPWKGSADLFTVAQSNAWAIFPPGDRDFGIGDQVDVVLNSF